jgi:transcription termination factor Rho
MEIEQKGVIQEHSYYTVKLSGGEEIAISKEEVTRLGLEHGCKVSGYVNSVEKQDKYTDGTYARSFTATEEFIIEDFEKL